MPVFLPILLPFFWRQMAVSALGAILVNKIEIVFVEIGVKATEHQNLGHSALTRSAFNVNDYVQRLGNVCLDGFTGYFDSRRKSHTSASLRNHAGVAIEDYWLGEL